MRIFSHATVLISDVNMILPTVMVALQLAQAGEGLTDVLMLTGGLTPYEFEILRATLEPYRVKAMDCSKEISSLIKEFDFPDTHVSPTSLARLLLDDILPHQYEHILYLDGDTYVAGDLAELFRLRVPPGKIAAALESLFLHVEGTSEFAVKLRKYRAHFSSFGPDQYFNAGILAAQRTTWRLIGPQALSFYRDHYADCIFHDQSALNVICENSVHWISPKYNFGTDFRLMGFNLYFKPSIYHFSGPSKPWNSRINPWSPSIYSSYGALIKKHDCLRCFMRNPGPEHLRKIRNRLIAHAVRDAPGLRNPILFFQKHAFFRDYLSKMNFRYSPTG